jgi:ankyrin repeat protein
LSVAAFYGAPMCVHFLLTNGESVNDRHDDDQRLSPIHWAIAGGSPEIIRLFVDQKPIMSDCLKVAIKYHCKEVFDWLIENGFDDSPCAVLEL